MGELACNATPVHMVLPLFFSLWPAGEYPLDEDHQKDLIWNPVNCLCRDSKQNPGCTLDKGGEDGSLGGLISSQLIKRTELLSRSRWVVGGRNMLG